jgi:hypothetical protein
MSDEGLARPHALAMLMLVRKSALVVALWCVNSAVSAHPGGLNGEGCHNNRKTGDYHCHRAASGAATPKPPPSDSFNRPRSFAPEGAVSTIQPRIGTRPACHVGPRGGTYTITASGRKNYGGC